MTSVGVMSFREVPEYFYFTEINIFYLRCFFNHSRAKEAQQREHPAEVTFNTASGIPAKPRGHR